MTSKIKSFDELKSVQERLKAGRDPKKPCITVCVGTGCLAYGTRKLVDNFREELLKRNLAGKIDFRTSGCHGFCERGPMVVISPEKIFYQRVGLADAGEIIDKTVLTGRSSTGCSTSIRRRARSTSTRTTSRSTRNRPGSSSARTARSIRRAWTTTWRSAATARWERRSPG